MTEVTPSGFVAVTQRRQLDNIGLNAALIGTGSTSVLRWNAAATVNSGLGGWAAASWSVGSDVNDAVLGTVIRISRRGMYHVALSITTEAAGAAAAFGISLNAPAATLLQTANPINGTAGIVLGQAPTTPAATQIPVNLAVMLPISDTQAGDTAGVGNALIRFHGNDAAGGALVDGDLLQAVARYTITYVGDLMGV